MALSKEKETNACGTEMTVTKCVTVSTFKGTECQSSPGKWVNCISLDPLTQQLASKTHMLLHSDILNQQLHLLPMLITPVLSIYLITFNLHNQEDSLAKIHSVMKDVYTVSLYRNEAGEKVELPEVFLVGMHADMVEDAVRSSFAQKLDERLKKMPYNRLIEKPEGGEPFWAVNGEDLSLSGAGPLSECIRSYGCNHQIEVHQWMEHHDELQEKHKNAPCILYCKLKEEVAQMSSEVAGTSKSKAQQFDAFFQFLRNYGFVFYHSANEGKNEADKVVLLQPEELCGIFAKVREFSKNNHRYSIADLFKRPAACEKVSQNRQWFQRICSDMGLVVELHSEYVFLMCCEAGPVSLKCDEYSVPPLLIAFRPNCGTEEREVLLPSFLFAAFVTEFLKVLPKQNGRLPLIKQHYMMAKKGTAFIHVVERDFCIEIGFQQRNIGLKGLPVEKKMQNLLTMCREIQTDVRRCGDSTLRRLKLDQSSIQYGFYHTRESDGSLDSFGEFIALPDSPRVYLECSCCDDIMHLTNPLQDVWFLDLAVEQLQALSMETVRTSSVPDLVKLQLIPHDRVQPQPTPPPLPAARPQPTPPPLPAVQPQPTPPPLPAAQPQPTPPPLPAAEGPMSQWNIDALVSLQGELKLKVLMSTGLINKLQPAAGGFMSPAEEQRVKNQRGNDEQIGELIAILKGKRNKDFDTFLTMLRAVNYEVWADELMKEAEKFRRESGHHVTGQGSVPVTPPPTCHQQPPLAVTGNVWYNKHGVVVQGVGAGAIRTEDKDMVKRAVVHIRTNDSKLGRGSGFIAELEVNRAEKKIVLMTCNHVLPTWSAAEKATFFFGRDSEKKPGTTIEGKDLLDSSYFLTDDKQFPGWERKFDYTVVGVNMNVMESYLHNEAPTPLSLSACTEMMKEQKLAVNDQLYMIHYPNQPVAFDRYENAEHICRLEGPYIGHMATSYGGSSGSPILREYNNKLIVVGLHRGDLSTKDEKYTYVNFATLITVIVNDIRMVEYEGTFPDLGNFAREAKKHADALKLAQPQQPPDEQTGPGGQ